MSSVSNTSTLTRLSPLVPYVTLGSQMFCGLVGIETAFLAYKGIKEYQDHRNQPNYNGEKACELQDEYIKSIGVSLLFSLASLNPIPHTATLGTIWTVLELASTKAKLEEEPYTFRVISAMVTPILTLLKNIVFFLMTKVPLSLFGYFNQKIENSYPWKVFSSLLTLTALYHWGGKNYLPIVTL